MARESSCRAICDPLGGVADDAIYSTGRIGSITNSGMIEGGLGGPTRTI